MRLFLFLILVFSIKFCYSQDYILLINGEEIQAKIVEVDDSRIIYTELQDTITNLTVLIQDVFMIKYSNGEKTVFDNNSRNYGDTPNISSLTEKEIIERAVADANIFYNCYKSQCATGCLTLTVWPCGIGIAALSSSQMPKDDNLNIPVSDYTNNKTYIDYYKATAFKIKKRKVWTTFALCMAINIPLIALSFINQ